MSTNITSVLKLYTSVMDDVISGVREAFLDEGVDEQVLYELKQLWETKLAATKAAEPLSVPEPQPPPLNVQLQDEFTRSNTVSNDRVSSELQPKKELVQQEQTQIIQKQQQVPQMQQLQQQHQPQMQQHNPRPMNIQNPQQQFKQYPGSSGTSQQIIQDMNNKLVPIQLTLPGPAGSLDTQSRIFNIQVPASALSNNQLQQVLTAPVISATMSLPTNVASTLLQQHITAALQGLSTSIVPSSTTGSNSNNQTHVIPENMNSVRQFPHVNQISGTVSQVDGNNDTSDEDDEDDDDEDDDMDDDEDDDDDDESEDKEDDDDDNAAEGGAEEDPLNSEDDVSEGDAQELFDTDNVVVCQYDKITRSRNKWKFYLKDGIMNLSGKDFVFQRGNGDAECYNMLRSSSSKATLGNSSVLIINY